MGTIKNESKVPEEPIALEQIESYISELEEVIENTKSNLKIYSQFRDRKLKLAGVQIPDKKIRRNRNENKAEATADDENDGDERDTEASDVDDDDDDKDDDSNGTKKRDAVMASIIELMSDGKPHPLSEIAEKCENLCSYLTVSRVLQGSGRFDKISRGIYRMTGA